MYYIAYTGSITFLQENVEIYTLLGSASACTGYVRLVYHTALISQAMSVDDVTCFYSTSHISSRLENVPQIWVVLFVKLNSSHLHLSSNDPNTF